jgi:hypothetical protein
MASRSYNNILLFKKSLLEDDFFNQQCLFFCGHYCVYSVKWHQKGLEGELKVKIRKRNSEKSKSGLVLPLVAAIALCLALLGLGVLKLGFGSRLMSTRTMSGVSARAAADAGVTRALYELNALFSLGDDPLTTPMPPDATDMPLNNSTATYSYKVRGPFTELPEPYWVIESIGKLGTQVKTVYATLGVRNLFDYGLIVTKTIDLKSDTLIDGYNSNLGPYTEYPDTTNSHAYIRIGTTSVTPNAIWLHQDTWVTGDILAGVGGEVDEVIEETPTGGSITGPWYNLPEPWYFEPIIIPDETFISSGSINNSTPWDGTGSYRVPEVVTGNPIYLQYDNIDVPNGRSLIFLGPVVIIINQNLELDNAASLFVGEPDATMPNYGLPSSVTIYLNGDLLVRNGGNINNLSRIPLNFQLYGTGLPYQDWDIYNSGDYYGIYYGPNADIRTYTAAEFFGSVSGHTFLLFNGGRLHYDHALSGIIGYDTGFGIDRLWEKSDFVVAAGP